MPNYYYSRVVLEICEELGQYRQVRAVKHFYRGEWRLAKGDKIAKQSEQLGVQQQQQQITFDQQLMDLFNKQYSSQQQTLQYLQSRMQPMIENPTGYSDQALPAMRTSATDTNSSAFQNAQQALQERTQQMSGGSKLAGLSGADVEAQAALLNSAAQNESAAQNNITLQNENLKQQNRWNAINVLNGVAAQQNPLGYSSQANAGSGTTAELENAVSGSSSAVTASQQSQLLGALGGITGGLATGWATGGFKV